MDEIWQRHKAFIVQVFVGAVVLVVALIVMNQTFGGSDGPKQRQNANAGNLSAAKAQIEQGRAPSQSSIAEQRQIADAAERQRLELAARVASTAADTDAYVQESIRAILAAIGSPGDYDNCWGLYRQFPQACLSRLRENTRGALVGRAAQTGKEIDEQLGIGGAFQDDEVPAALHGLALAADVVGRCLARPGIRMVGQVRISPRSSFPERLGVGFVSAIEVHVEITGEPADVLDVLRSFNPVDKPQQRMVVLESIEGVTPLRQDEDTVKASLNIVGLRAKSEAKAEGT